MHDLEDVRLALDAAMPKHRADLERLVAIPSVSADGFDAGQVRRSAEAVRDLLDGHGFEHTRLLEVPGAHPAVYGDWLHAGEGAPTLLCYAHHDVQPPGDPALWTSPPFEPVERDGRLYGRGAADDKAGIFVHLGAASAWLQARGALPVNLKVFLEGEEEIGSTNLDEFLATYAEMLRADVLVVTDSVNWGVGVPSLTYMLRGLIDATVEVSALSHALHSGMFGGPVADPLNALTKVLAGLTDDHGEIAIPGFCDDVREPTPDERARLAALEFDEQRFRGEAGMLEGVEFTGGDHHLLEKLWMRPSVTVIGLDATPVAQASNTILPSARARVTVRLAPGQDAERALDRLCAWLADAVPWGLHATITPGNANPAFVADPYTEPAKGVFEAAGRALEAAYGHPVVYAGVGGSIPFIGPLTSLFGGAPALLTGVEDPDTRAHGIDESLHLADWRNACLGEAYLFGELAGDREPAPAAGA